MDTLDVVVRPGSRSGIVVMEISGPLVLQTVVVLQNVVRADSSPVTILDMTNVPYVDSVGIGALINAYVSREKCGRLLGLVGANDRARNVLRITRVEKFFRFFDSVAAAETALAAAM